MLKYFFHALVGKIVTWGKSFLRALRTEHNIQEMEEEEEGKFSCGGVLRVASPRASYIFFVWNSPVWTPNNYLPTPITPTTFSPHDVTHEPPPHFLTLNFVVNGWICVWIYRRHGWDLSALRYLTMKFVESFLCRNLGKQIHNFCFFRC